MIKLKKISICAILVVCIVCSMCPTFAYAVDYTTESDVYSLNIARPIVDEHHAYAEFLMRVWVPEWNDWGYFPYVVTFSVSEYLSNNSGSTDIVDPLMVLNIVNSSKYYQVAAGTQANDYYVGCVGEFMNGTYRYFPLSSSSGQLDLRVNHGYQVVGFRAYGFDDVTYDLAVNENFTILYNDEAPIYYKLTELYLLISSFEKYIEIDTDYLNSIMNSSATTVDKLEELITYYVEILPLLRDINTNVSEINEYIKSIESLLSTILMYVEEIDLICWFINGELQTVNSTLLDILEALNLKGESNLTSPDTSNNDKYYDMEQSLLDNSGVDVNNAVNVEIDQNALVVIWDMVQSLYDTHPQVFGLVITVLSLSIIALILGRGKS